MIAFLSAGIPPSQPIEGWANSAEFRGKGASVFPARNADIELVSETLVIRANRTAYTRLHHERWHYDCNFVLRNTSDRPVKITVGFPEIRHEMKRFDTGRTMIQGFSAVVDGKTS